jgi:tetratricopeptide (TPR) repeat protein
MKRTTASLLLFLSPLLFAGKVWGQAAAPRIEKATAKTANGAVRVAPVPQRLFGSIAISTRSEEARKFVELALDKYENALMEDAVVHARHATEKDPNSALAFAVLAFTSRRSVPDPASLARAKTLMAHATPDEQLLVRWMTNVEGQDLLPAITSMNDLLKRFPKDKQVLYLTAEWLYFQQDYDRSRKMFEHVLQIDPDFAPALNMLGYTYIETGNPDPARALAALKRYAELQGSAPNPEDSLGEVSRFAGDDRGSLEHYGAALQVDPFFFTSQLGLGDTLTLMGNFKDAREEYDRAIKISETPRDTFHAKYQKALVYFWEGKSGEGRDALAALAKEAEESKEPYAINEIGLGRAMLAADSATELQLLQSQETFLGASVAGMSDADRGPALAAVLREEVRIACLNGQVHNAEQIIAKLEKLAGNSRDLIIESNYESARGYLLFAKGDFVNAGDELAADPHSPLALQRLAMTQEKLGNAADAENTRTRLKYQRAPIVEWFLVAGKSASSSD